MFKEEMVVNILLKIGCVLCFAVSVFAVVNAELWWQKLISIFAIVVSIVSPVMIFIV